MNSWITSIFGYLLFGLFSSSINWHQLHWGSHVYLYYPIIVFCWANYSPKCLHLCTFLLRLLFILVGFNTIRNVHLDDFSQESCKRTKGKKEKEFLKSNALERNHIFWINLSLLFICLLYALLTCQFHLPRYKITINLSGKYGRSLCRNACGEDCRAFPHSTNVSPVISY